MLTGITVSVDPLIWMPFTSMTTVMFERPYFFANRRASATCPFACSPSLIST